MVTDHCYCCYYLHASKCFLLMFPRPTLGPVQDFLMCWADVHKGEWLAGSFRVAEIGFSWMKRFRNSLRYWSSFWSRKLKFLVKLILSPGPYPGALYKLVASQNENERILFGLVSWVWGCDQWKLETAEKLSYSWFGVTSPDCSQLAIDWCKHFTLP